MISQEVDLAVIGAGPAGLAAAIKAKEAGLDKVTIVERGESLGGPWEHPTTIMAGGGRGGSGSDRADRGEPHVDEPGPTAGRRSGVRR